MFKVCRVLERVILGLTGVTNSVIASEAKQSRATSKDWIASSQVLLAMTGRAMVIQL
jgi:hypothetical protein